MDNLLSITTFIPAIAAAILALFLRGDDEAAQRNAKWLAMAATAMTFVVSLFILIGFDANNTDFQFVEDRTWIMGFNYKMGVDGISILFVMLTTFLMPLVIASCWSVTDRVKEYMIAFLLLETLMLGVFMALDLVLFYLFFEAGLIPMFLIIGIWGGANRIVLGFGFDVGRNGRHVCRRWHHRHSNIDELYLRDRNVQHFGHPDYWRHADAAVAGLLRELCGENADVAGPHLVT